MKDNNSSLAGSSYVPVRYQSEILYDEEPQTKTEKKVDEMLVRYGGNRFTSFVALMMVLGLCSRDWWFYMLPWLTQSPVYNCVWADGKEHPQDECTWKTICAENSQVIRHSIDWDSPESLHNWIEKLDATCEPRWKISFISSAYFLGWGITLLWLPMVSDKYGRKIFFVVGCILDLVMYTGIMLTKSLNAMITLSFLDGLSASLV